MGFGGWRQKYTEKCNDLVNTLIGSTKPQQMAFPVLEIVHVFYQKKIHNYVSLTFPTEYSHHYEQD